MATQLPDDPSASLTGAACVATLTAAGFPTSPETLLTRVACAAALTAAGFPTSPDTLATKASRGGGPPFSKYGPRVLYPWGAALEWARSRLRPVVNSTAELDRMR
jgi:hypothetical protein